MSNVDRDTITGLILIVCLCAVYFNWLKYELHAGFSERMKEVEEKLTNATLAVAAEPDLSRPRMLLAQARRWMRDIKAFEKEVDLHKDVDDLIAVRRQLYHVDRYVDHAMRLLSQPALPGSLT